MKVLKLTAVLFAATLVFSAIKAAAANNWYFAGITITGYSTTYLSSARPKEHATQQQFELTSCADTFWWSDRNLRVQVEKISTAQWTAVKEFEVGDKLAYTDGFVKTNTSGSNDFRLRMKIANPLVSEVYFSGTWYID